MRGGVWTRVAATLTGAVVVGIVLWWGGAFGPRLVATPVRVAVDDDSVTLGIRLTNRGWWPGVAASVMRGNGVDVRAVSPAADWSPRGFRDGAIAAGASREVDLVLAPPCLADPSTPWSLRIIAYGPTGGAEVLVPFTPTPAAAVPGAATGAGDWQEGLVAAADCGPAEVRQAELARAPLVAGRPRALADGRPLPPVPEGLAEVLAAPVVVAERVARIPAYVEGCPSELDDDDLVAGWVTPERLELIFLGAADGWSSPEIREVCSASYEAGGWSGNGSEASARDGAADDLALPADAAWAVVDEDTYRLVYDVRGLANLPSPCRSATTTRPSRSCGPTARPAPDSERWSSYSVVVPV